MRTAVWRDISFLCGSAVLILCFLQIPGWLRIPTERSGAFVLTAMAAQAAAYFLTFPVERSASVLFYGVCETAAASALCVWWCVWWVALEPSMSFCASMIAAAAGAFIASMLLRAMAVDTLASSINAQLAKQQADRERGDWVGSPRREEIRHGDHKH